jgi:hypothetical protein
MTIRAVPSMTRGLRREWGTDHPAPGDERGVAPLPGHSRFPQQALHNPRRSRGNRHEPSNPTILQLYRRGRAVVTPSSPCPLSLKCGRGAIVNRLTSRTRDCRMRPRQRLTVRMWLWAHQESPQFPAIQRVAPTSMPPTGRVRVHGSRVTVVQRRTRCGSTEAAPAAIGPEPTSQGASVSSDEWHLEMSQHLATKSLANDARRQLRNEYTHVSIST